MSKHFALGHHLPAFITKPLFGDRKKFGLEIQHNDSCWKEWQSIYTKFYYETQKKSIGQVVNNAGYKIMSQVDLDGKKLLEIGAGDLNHIQHWQGKPKLYTIADINEKLLDISASKLEQNGITYRKQLLNSQSSELLPFATEEFDIVISFYSLEHLHPLEVYFKETCKTLRSGGVLVGAIPCEGGLGWGLGRFLTSRRWFLTHTTINPDKIICWEHPNFADNILEILDKNLNCKTRGYWPFSIPNLDLNLVTHFIYQKP